MSTHELIARYNKASTRKALLTRDVQVNTRKKKRLTKDIKALDKSRLILTEAGKIIQKRIQKKVESLVTLAVRSVYDRPLTFKLVFEEKRKHMEAKPLILERGIEYIPKDQLGGGVIDLIGFALRIVLWQLSSPRSRNFFILDEPFRFSGVLVRRIGKMAKYLSREMGFQLVIISHDDELIEICDRVYKVTHNGKESVVKLIKGRWITRLAKKVKRIIKRR